jgi:hypothetical protein
LGFFFFTLVEGSLDFFFFGWVGRGDAPSIIDPAFTERLNQTIASVHKVYANQFKQQIKNEIKNTLYA